MSTSLARTVQNFWRNGLKRSLRQIAQMNDTKSGRLVGVDDFGNHFYETTDKVEIHLRTRWCEYPNFWRPDMSQVEPGWHFWLAYGTDVPPNQLKESEKAIRHVTEKQHQPNLVLTKGMYVPYNTAKPKCTTWAPEVKARA